jgi:hypothetical protein
VILVEFGATSSQSAIVVCQVKAYTYTTALVTVADIVAKMGPACGVMFFGAAIVTRTHRQAFGSQKVASALAYLYVWQHIFALVTLTGVSTVALKIALS